MIRLWHGIPLFARFSRGRIVQSWNTGSKEGSWIMHRHEHQILLGVFTFYLCIIIVLYCMHIMPLFIPPTWVIRINRTESRKCAYPFLRVDLYAVYNLERVSLFIQKLYQLFWILAGFTASLLLQHYIKKSFFSERNR